jgi:MFS family permease
LTETRGNSPDGDSPSFRARIPALVLISMTQFMIPFDYLSITLASLEIRADLHMSAAMAPWILSSYILTFGGFLLLGGRLADLFGRRRVLVIGLLTFGLFSLITAFTTNSTMFLAARICKGIGAALLSPSMLSLLNTLFPAPRERHRALGTYWFCAVSGGAAGVWLGGALIDISWRLALFVNVPIALSLALLAPRILPESRKPEAGKRIDYGGALCSTVGFGSLIMAVTNTLTEGLGARTLWLLGVTFVSFTAFYLVEKAHPTPLVPPAFFRFRNLVGANLFSFFWAAANTNYPVSLFLQQVFHFSPGRAGLAMLPHSLIGLASIALVVRLLDRYGAFRTMLLGALTEASGELIFCTLVPQSTYLYMFPGLALTSIGFALAGISVKLPAAADPKEGDQGVAGGLVFSTQQLGNAFAVPVYSAVLATASRWGSGAKEDILAFGFHWTFAAAILFLIFGAAAVIFLVRGPRPIKRIAEGSNAALGARDGRLV